MMEGLTSRFGFWREALSVRRLLAIPFIFGVAFLVYRNLPAVTQGRTTLWGVPDWFWALATAFLALLIFVFEYGHRLYVSLQPKLKLSFDPGGVGIQVALDRAVIPGPIPGTWTCGAESKSSYVRIKAEALTKGTVGSCLAFIKDLERRENNGATITPIILPHRIALGDAKPFDVYPELPHMVDVVKSSESDNKLIVTGHWPFHLLDAFNTPAIYRLTIVVIAAGVPATVRLDVDWNGTWNTITAAEVP
jgi:hypothetical protein